MKRNGIAVLTALIVLSAAGSALAAGVGVGFRLPSGDFGDAYDGGFGANFTMAYPLAPTVSAYGDIGYTRFMGKSASVGGVEVGPDDLDVWGFSAGAKVGLGGFYLGGEGGYFTEVDEFGLSPLLGLGLGPLDISARYKFTGDANWFDLRASISFGP